VSDENPSGTVKLLLRSAVLGDAVVSLTYKWFWFSREIVAHCVWQYHRVTHSLKEIELLVAEWGVEMTIRGWCVRFGPE
jgi:putative transposase